MEMRGNLYENSNVFSTGNRPYSEASEYSYDDVYVNEQNAETDQTRSTKKPMKTASGTNTSGSRCSRLTAVCLGLLCVLLLIVIIVMWITITAERDQLCTRCNVTNQEKLSAIELNARQGWVYFNSKFYYISPINKNWTDSREECRNRGADMVIITSTEEQIFTAALTGSNTAWIGLTDTEEEGVWTWVDGTALTTRYWNENEPNNLGNNENCAETGSSEKKGWNDASCCAERMWISRTSEGPATTSDDCAVIPTSESTSACVTANILK
ncbi:uncharacterized protein LOC143524273 isoform X1 [Brachyhypopomus gauderio]|uniref:uncharacterized protein LOC143524273 isoform X1 n=1 Tax=Brachyhypopomus gauderio TaxID=698409 RepID=UPI004041FF2E